MKITLNMQSWVRDCRVSALPRRGDQIDVYGVLFTVHLVRHTALASLECMGPPTVFVGLVNDMCDRQAVVERAGFTLMSAHSGDTEDEDISA